MVSIPPPEAHPETLLPLVLPESLSLDRLVALGARWSATLYVGVMRIGLLI